MAKFYFTNQADVAWAAGLFEGEGCLTWHSVPDTVAGRRFKVSIGSNDKDVLDKFAALFPVGKVRGPYKDGKGRRVSWQYQCTIAEHVYAVVVALYPWLCSRRKARIEQFLTLFKQYRRKGCVNG